MTEDMNSKSNISIEQSFTDNKVKPGIYFFEFHQALNKIRQLSEEHNFGFYYLDGKSIMDKQSFLRKSAITFGFPNYYGENWDAFEECIRDFGWHPTVNGYIILYDHFDIFASHCPREFKIALEIFESAANIGKSQIIFLCI
jgi:RNAse (barnase) inhibitor barstar